MAGAAASREAVTNRANTTNFLMQSPSKDDPLDLDVGQRSSFSTLMSVILVRAVASALLDLVDPATLSPSTTRLTGQMGWPGGILTDRAGSVAHRDLRRHQRSPTIERNRRSPALQLMQLG